VTNESGLGGFAWRFTGRHCKPQGFCLHKSKSPFLYYLRHLVLANIFHSLVNPTSVKWQIPSVREKAPHQKQRRLTGKSEGLISETSAGVVAHHGEIGQMIDHEEKTLASNGRRSEGTMTMMCGAGTTEMRDFNGATEPIIDLDRDHDHHGEGRRGAKGESLKRRNEKRSKWRRRDLLSR
jgi:hypothetical protein